MQFFRVIHSGKYPWLNPLGQHALTSAATNPLVWSTGGLTAKKRRPAHRSHLTNRFCFGMSLFAMVYPAHSSIVAAEFALAPTASVGTSWFLAILSLFVFGTAPQTFSQQGTGLAPSQAASAQNADAQLPAGVSLNWEKASAVNVNAKRAEVSLSGIGVYPGAGTQLGTAKDGLVLDQGAGQLATRARQSRGFRGDAGPVRYGTTTTAAASGGRGTARGGHSAGMGRSSPAPAL